MRSRKTSLVVPALGGLAASLICPAVSLAQTPPAAPSSESGLQEVVVTAERRTSTVQGTAISITALGAEELESRGATTLASVATTVPGISQRTSGPGLTEYEMRGLASSGGSASTVGFYLDDTPLTAPAGSQWGKVVIDTDLYDVDRLEVLRGPQGTLYGAGSMGGTIKVRTKEAKLDTFETSAEVIGSGTQGGGVNARASGMVNMPLATDLAVRVVGTLGRQSGWIDRVVVAGFPGQPSAAERGDVTAEPTSAIHTNVNDRRALTARVTATYTPTDTLSIVPTILYQRMTADGLGTYDSDPGTEAHFQPYDIAEPTTDRTLLASLAVTYHSAAFDTQLSLSRWKRKLHLVQDESEVNSVLLSTLFGIIPPGAYDPPDGLGPANVREESFLTQTSAELRLVSAGEGRLAWVVGGFFGKFDNEWSVNSQVPGSAAFFGTANQITFVQPQTVKQTAAFADVSYRLADHLKLNVGGRVFRYTDDLTTTQSGWVTITGSDDVLSAPASVTEHGFKPKVTLSYEPTADLTVFSTVAQGFRPGGGNAPVPVSGPSDCTPFLQQLGMNEAPTFYHSDRVTSYELGEKWRVLDRRVTLNASAFHTDWSRVQQTVPLGCGYSFTGNEGKARVDGLEFEGEYLLTGGWWASTNFAYTHARLAEDVPATGGRKGDRLQNTPRWTAAGAVRYTMDLANAWQMTARISGAYVGDHIDATYGVNELPGYFLADARVTLATERWSLGLFVDNLTDKHAALSNVAALSANLQSYNRVAMNQPRTVGLRFSLQQ